MADAALATMYETYSMACGLRKDGIPQLATMQRFWKVCKSAADWTRN